MLSSDFWDRYFAVYDVLNELYPYQQLLQKFVETADIKPNTKVLDAGAGTGNLSLLLKEKGAALKTIDISEAGTRRILEKIPEAQTYIGSLCDALPYENNEFDVIVSNNVIYTLPEKDRPSVAREFYRILKPGGKVLVSNISPGFSPFKIYVAHIREELDRNGLIGALVKIIKFIPPTIEMFVYNAKIKKENSGGEYSFLNEETQEEFLSTAGFKNISKGERTYANQAVFHQAEK